MIYLNGEWVASTGDTRIPVEDPYHEVEIGSVPAGTASDIDRAVAAARAAFDDWSRTSVADRAKLLIRIRDVLTRRGEEIASTISAEMGAPITMATKVQAGLPVRVLSSYAETLTELTLAEEIGNSMVVSEAVGVVGAITPWNYPLHQAVAKVGAALAAGCTVVLKPSEVAPLSAFLLTEAIHEAGVPAGVFNLVPGTGVEAGEALAAHPDVDMVSFTGSTRAGRRVGALAADTVKRVALELGGKSANVILPDADLVTAVKAGVANCFLNSGQTCNAWTRMLVPAAQHSEAAALAVKYCERYIPGDPSDPTTRLGPLASAAQRERVRDLIATGVAEGATLAVGGAEPPADPDHGYFVRPTVFTDVDSSMTIAQREIFGPVLCVLPYADCDDALRIANDSWYGLAGAVWSADTERATAFARRMRTGQVDVNGGQFNTLAPFGGYKQSGHGREFGRYGIAEFLEVKSIQR